MRNKFTYILISFIILHFISPVIIFAEDNDFAGGSGTERDPYQVSTPEQLDNVRKYLNAHYIQTKDIDMTAATATGGVYYNNGKGWEPIGSGSFWNGSQYDYSNLFIGEYDGGGYKITGLKVNRTVDIRDAFIGLFGCNGGTIKNLGMVGGNIKGVATTEYSSSYVGGIAGYNDEGTITNCYNTSAVSTTNAFDSFVGGIAGFNNNGIITDCHNTGTVSSNDSLRESFAGGIVAWNSCRLYDSTTIANCYNTGNVFASAVKKDSYSYVGGIVANNSSNEITDCYNTGNISASNSNSATYSRVGGIAGCNGFGSTITNSYNTGSVSASGSAWAYVGGVSGFHFNGTVKKCFNAGVISSSNTSDSYVGGIVGYNGNRTVLTEITDCYNIGNISSSGSSQSHSGGIAGVAGDNWLDETSKITNCYSIGNVSASGTAYPNVGGIVGSNRNFGIEQPYNYWNIDRNQMKNGVMVSVKRGWGNIDGNFEPGFDGDRTISKTTAQMKLKESFIGLDFDNVWAIVPNRNSGYPILQSLTPANLDREIKNISSNGNTYSFDIEFTNNTFNNITTKVYAVAYNSGKMTGFSTYNLTNLTVGNSTTIKNATIISSETVTHIKIICMDSITLQPIGKVYEKTIK